jgi:hypothetical protein
MPKKILLSVLPFVLVFISCGQPTEEDKTCDLDSYCRFILDKCPEDWSGWPGSQGNVASCVQRVKTVLASNQDCYAPTFTECVCAFIEGSTICDDGAAVNASECLEAACTI